MKKQIRLNENELYSLITMAAKKILAERHVLKVPHDDSDEDLPPIGMEDNSMPNDDFMGGEPPMKPTDGMNEPMTDDNMGGNSEIDDIMAQLSTEQQSSVIKYAKSMIQDNGSNPQNGSEEDMGGQDSMPMQEGNLKEFNNVVFDKREKQRRQKKLGNVNRNSPFVSNR